MGRTFRLRRGAGYLAAILCGVVAVAYPHGASTPAIGARAARPPITVRCGASGGARMPEVCASTVGPHPAALVIDEQVGRVFVLNQGTARQRGGVSVSILDAATGAVLRTTPVGQSPASLAVDARTHRVFVLSAGANASSAPGSARLTTLDARTGRPLRSASPGALSGPIAVAGRLGRLFAIKPVATGYRLAMLDATSLAIQQTSTLFYQPLALALDERHGRVFVVWTEGPYDEYGAVSVFDAATDAVIAPNKVDQEVGAQPGAIVVDATGGFVFVAHQNNINSSGSPRLDGSVAVLAALNGGG